MNDYSINFPNLGIYLEYVPKTFEIFGIRIAFYGIIITCGIFLALCYVLREAKRTGQKEEHYWDLTTWLVVCSIVGARIYYVVFSWDMYKDNLLSIFNIRNGGLAIYGGVIAGAITIYVFSLRKKLSFLQMADNVIPGLLIGQILGRFGNFTNREAFGEYTDNLFAMQLPVSMVRQKEITAEMAAHMTENINYIQVHPTFLYEALWNTGVLLLILMYRKHKRFHGELMALYFMGYGAGRVWIEGLRTDQLLLPEIGLPVSQVLAVILFFAGLGILLFGKKIGKMQQDRENVG